MTGIFRECEKHIKPKWSFIDGCVEIIIFEEQRPFLGDKWKNTSD